MTMQLDPTRPIYLQLMEEIKRRTVRGEYAPGSQIPSVRDMAKEMEVNPNTIARVYRELEREGFIETRRGQGSFITDDTGRIEKERTALGRAATERFLGDIGELALTGDQVRDILALIEQALVGEKVKKSNENKNE